MEQTIGEEIIVVGDRVDLVAGKGQVYRAMIEDRIENGPFLIAIPSHQGTPMSVEQGDETYLVFYRESGRYIAQMKVVALERRGGIRYMWLLQKTVAHKNQRRTAYRLPVDFTVLIYKYGDDMKKILAEKAGDTAQTILLDKTNSMDISITGVSVLSKNKYTLGDYYVLEMHMEGTSASVAGRRMPSNPQVLRLEAIVQRCIPWRAGNMYNVGMYFCNMTRDASESIARFVLTEQQRQLKMRGFR